jgi:hypothetical protein
LPGWSRREINGLVVSASGHGLPGAKCLLIIKNLMYFKIIYRYIIIEIIL